jgi:hypothetical protein
MKARSPACSTEMNFAELAQKHYFHEVARRNDLNSSLGIPLGILTALFAAIATMATSISSPFNLARIILLLTSALATLAGLVSIYFFVKSYLGYMYRHPTSMEPLRAWREQIIANGDTEQYADEQVDRVMTKQYSEAAELNSKNNDDKSGYIHRAGVSLVICLVLVLLSSIPYIYVKTKSPDDLKGLADRVSMQIDHIGGPSCGTSPVSPAAAAPSSAATSGTTNARHSRKRGSKAIAVAGPRSVSSHYPAAGIAKVRQDTTACKAQ